MTEAIYEGTNYQWTTVSLALLAIFVWTAIKAHTLEARVFAIGMALLETAILGRILFWEVATYFAMGGVQYHPEVVDKKWIMFIFVQAYFMGTLMIAGPALKRITKHWILVSVMVAGAAFTFGTLTYDMEFISWESW